MTKPTLGSWMRKRRKELGKTQQEVSDESGIDLAQLSRYENNKARPYVNRFWKWCAALSVDPKQVMERVSDR